MALRDAEVRERVARAEELLAALEEGPEQGLRETALGAVSLLLELQGEALRRILAWDAREGRGHLRRACGRDEWLASLLALHGLAPEALAARVEAGLAEVRPMLRQHGGDVELVTLRDGVAHLRLLGSCHGCPSSAATLRGAVESALRRAAPELEGIETEGAASQSEAEAKGALIPLSSLSAPPACPAEGDAGGGT